MKLYVICKESKSGNKYLALYKRAEDETKNDKFISNDFSTIKAILGKYRYSKMSELLEGFEVGQIVEVE